MRADGETEGHDEPIMHFFYLPICKNALKKGGTTRKAHHSVRIGKMTNIGQYWAWLLYKATSQRAANPSAVSVWQALE